jgi:hypothetical protein
LTYFPGTDNVQIASGKHADFQLNHIAIQREDAIMAGENIDELRCEIDQARGVLGVMVSLAQSGEGKLVRLGDKAVRNGLWAAIGILGRVGESLSDCQS